jgi:hypothetical protein
MYANMFTVHKGEDRIALVGETSTLKVARVDAGRCLDSAHLAWKRGGLPRLQHEWASLPVDQHQSMQYYMFRGVTANRTEAQLASEYPDAIIPTTALLGGLANLQPTVETIEPDNLEIHRLFIDLLGQRAVKLHLGHTLEPEKYNLGRHNGRVKFIDAGSDGLRHLLSAEPDKIHQALELVSASLSKE